MNGSSRHPVGSPLGSNFESTLPVPRVTSDAQRVRQSERKIKGVALSRELATGGLGRRLRDWFPDREFFMRSQGQIGRESCRERVCQSVLISEVAVSL